MNSPQKHPVDDAFNAKSVDAVTYETLAAQVRAMKPAAIPEEARDDAVTIIAWMHSETTKRIDRAEILLKELDARTRDLEKREVALAQRQRLVAAAAAMVATKRRSWLPRWVRGRA